MGLTTTQRFAQGAWSAYQIQTSSLEALVLVPLGMRIFDVLRFLTTVRPTHFSTIEKTDAGVNGVYLGQSS